jgi:hypothetical protein
MILEMTSEDVEFIATALILRCEELLSIPEDERTDRSVREIEVLFEVRERLHDIEFEHEVAVGSADIFAGVKKLLSES